MTPYVLIAFSFLGLKLIQTVEERLLDTFIGSALAFTSTFVIFPNWESDQVNQTLSKVLISNQKFLKTVTEHLGGKELVTVEYKLARKDVYVESGNLSAAFERMISEPKSKQKHTKEIHKFVVLNNMLSSAISAIAANFTDKNSTFLPAQIKIARHAQIVLKETSKKLTPATANDLEIVTVTENKQEPTPETQHFDVLFLDDQLRFILKICTDISKITDTILS